MSADADDLLERVARAEERDVPTLAELKTELEQTLDEIERRFPDGRPSRGHSGLDRLSYQTLMLRITNYRWQLETGDYTEWPRELLSVEQSVPDVEWQGFLEAHPELSKPLTFADEDVLKALRVAIETREPALAARRGEFRLRRP